VTAHAKPNIVDDVVDVGLEDDVEGGSVVKTTRYVVVGGLRLPMVLKNMV
jgi:hypothetical protein